MYLSNSSAALITISLENSLPSLLHVRNKSQCERYTAVCVINIMRLWDI